VTKRVLFEWPQTRWYSTIDALNTRANPTKLFFTTKHIFFLFIAVKLGYLRADTIFSIFYKYSSLTARIGKEVKTKFGKIDTDSNYSLLIIVD